MRVLGIDPGAERLGWAEVEDGVYLDSGLITLPRNKPSETYQTYRLRIIETYSLYFGQLLDVRPPDLVVCETVPVTGGNLASIIQRQQAATASTVVQSLAYARGILVKQVAANTAKKKLTGNQKATKVAVRNKVIETFPELAPRKREWMKVFDETDAIGIAIISC
jgi:Holliday junction resolvasome RuvABC endonuclease subunit